MHPALLLVGVMPYTAATHSVWGQAVALRQMLGPKLFASFILKTISRVVGESGMQAARL